MLPLDDDSALDPFDPFAGLVLSPSPSGPASVDSHAPVAVQQKDAKKRARSHVDPEATQKKHNAVKRERSVNAATDKSCCCNSASTPPSEHGDQQCGRDEPGVPLNAVHLQPALARNQGNCRGVTQYLVGALTFGLQ